MLIGCAEEFLDVAPNNNLSVSITEVEHINRMYNGMEQPNLSDQVNVFCTDNAYMPQEILDETTSFAPEQIEHYTFSTSIDRSADGKWAAHYRHVLNPNLAIELLESGTLIGDDENLKKELLAESYYYRALHFFELAITYCLYYNNDTKDEPGIVLKKTSSMEESLKRATLKETWDFIVADIEEALKYPTIEKKSVFRIGKPSVHALAARIYLYLGNYEKAFTNANAALEGYSPMVDYASEIYLLDYYKWYGEFYLPNSSDITYYDLSRPDFYPDQYYYIESTNGWWNTSPSQELMDLYEPTDVRNLFYIKDWFERNGAETNKWWSYMSADVGVTLAGIGVAEMYLTRAECRARANDIINAMADVEMVRINRFHPDDYVPFAIPQTVKETVDLIIDERRREDPFKYRFMDIKRLNNDPLTEPIVIVREVNGETITIEPTDRRWARPLGPEVINLSKGATVQNKY